MSAPQLSISGLSKAFRRRGHSPVVALDDVSLAIDRGTIGGLVGESGSGKSTLIRCLLGLEKADAGVIEFEGVDMRRASRSDWREFRKAVQIVFQDPYSSLDPRMTVESIVGEGLVIHQKEPRRIERRVLVAEALESVGLSAKDMLRHPRSFSGGQRQRIAIARSIVMRPRLLVLDEPVSALDVSVQAQVINLLATMRTDLDLTMLFVAHDLAVVQHLCDTVSVIQHGRIVESGVVQTVFREPQHEYTRDLLEASPIPDSVAERARRQARASAE